MITLDRYLRAALPPMEPGLSATLRQVALAVKRISNELAVAPLRGRLGLSGATNVQGEKVVKLDTWSNDVFLDSFAGGNPICTLISEELEEAHHLERHHTHGSYALLFDPLDGSSNTDVNGSLGTIFALRRRKPGHRDDIADVLGPGTDQLAVGYALYGPATMLVWSAGHGVNAFVLEREVGEFVLWRENIRMPARGKTYAVNQANAARWHPGARALLERLTGPKDEGGGYSLRYCGAFVADFHRCLLTGGIFLYPGEVSAGGKSSGKLRLMYEVAPLSMLAERAGGAGSTGRGRVLDFVPGSIHERVPVYIGSAEEVALAERLKAEGG
ncbi:MAG TPA: class 1 fructose-bisphosphatase [Candidatus Binataceae bacterium]|nr:class 1 fructose-bisphosphatase [Candidatus Binataceae bacterium]